VLQGSGEVRVLQEVMGQRMQAGQQQQEQQQQQQEQEEDQQQMRPLQAVHPALGRIVSHLISRRQMT